MRLIDAEKAYKELIDSINWLREQDYEAYSAIGDDIRIVLDKQPTAFDVDKVVEQLELEMKKSKDEVDHGKGLFIKEPFTPYLKAIEIVKGGGI